MNNQSLAWDVSSHLFNAKKSTLKPNKCNASVTLYQVDRMHFHFS